MDQAFELLKTSRGVELADDELSKQPLTSSSFAPLISTLHPTHPREARTLTEVLTLCTQPSDDGGLNLTPTTPLTPCHQRKIHFLISAWLESLNSSNRSVTPPTPLPSRPSKRRGMTLTEKIFAHHDISRQGYVRSGMTISVSVDWILASDASWGGMSRTCNALNSPGIFRNNRFWLALDHVIDPRINHRPEVKKLIEQSGKGV
ncbi:hypothetical protein EK21DRAFT_113662 [Setomelanomma holmii]|uniref:Uncharacterized protein n=1 Tax=Setomelanomma holmii TaxID=210430 RepID=A0A9P4LM53_9PLEO|nr:hypothetical protein EK21DRAFT_113662 [Setomelanomma holmii]